MGSDEALTPDGQLQQLLAALDQTEGRVKKHSFQIVSLQNQLQVMHNARLEEAEERKRLLQDNERLKTKIAYLKGKLARLTVEFYYAQATASVVTTGPYDSEGRRSTTWWSTRHNNKTSSGTSVPPQEEEARPRNRAVEAVADRMLAEQRSLLDFAQMTQSLSSETRDQLNELDQAHFYDARENITDDCNKIKPVGADGSFSLEDGLLRAPAAATTT
ncbi:hypothetical protein J3459_002442 [Metarhizium acridum]|uniref:uncharacterized protein n=1 Tax=Metarhizium acridum TaxID=92637 RepID=UPI001C6C798B|nr:hypothetical protein J3458_001296 [Metarhizium acridum]KAG8428754.1 hypothetical protein J3459_002442 [Metarhizium acridum]